MAFFLPSSTSTSTSTSLSSSPLPVLRQLDSEDESRQSHDDGNASLRHRRSDDFPSTTRRGFTMFGLLSRQIEYMSGASASDISSLEENSSESEDESWTRRATFGDDEAEEDGDEFDDDDDDDMRRASHSTRDARSPSGRGRSPVNNNIQVSNDDRMVVGLSVGTSQRNLGAARAITTTTTTTGTANHTGPSTASEPNAVVASSTNQIEGEETVKRRNLTRHDTREVDRSRGRRVKPRNRRRDSSGYEGFICKYTSFYIYI
jgi:hypothetical protein